MTPALWQEAQQSISGHRSEETPLSDAQFYMEVRRIAALGDNGHSNVSGGPIYENFGVLPLRVYWFSDGPFIVRAEERFQNLLGARIEAVNGKAIGDLTTTLKEYHGGTQEFFCHYSAASLMLSAPLMHAIGLSESPEELTLTVTTLSGEKQEVAVPVDQTSNSVRTWPWRYLSPAPIEDEKGWATVLDTEAALELPRLASPEGQVYVLTGPATFSAGIYTSFYPKAADARQTVVVGEHVGDRPQFWAEIGPSFRLRDSNYLIGYSLQMHDLSNGCSDPVKCHMAQYPESWNIAVGTLAPDWPVPSTFADYESGRDPVMERVLADIQ